MTQAPENREQLVSTESGTLREQAVARIKQRRDFKTHAVTYALVNLALWGIWAIIGASSGAWWPWPAFVTVFWGIGLGANAWDVYGRRPITEDDVQHEMDRLGERPH